jgi:predicted TPR repeat methyltransferase
MASARLADDPLETANALLESGHTAEAAHLLRSLVAEGHGGLLARLMLARALSRSGETERAVEVAREAAQLHPDVPQAALGFGEAMLRADRLPLAIAEIQRALRLDPDLAAARYLLGRAWFEAGEAQKALDAFAAVSKEAFPDLPEKIAEAHAMGAASRADARYVRHLFDQFSADYDVRMQSQLHYAAPEILRQLADLVLPRKSQFKILDLGCGTGLSGLAFADLAARLDGIDLSPAMVALARARRIYGDLSIGDIEAELGAAHERYDVLLAADTLVYLGDLRRLFAAAFEALAPGGHFLFTVESVESGTFDLGPKRRWRHSEDYLRDTAAQTGFEVAGLVACSPRAEAGEPVRGSAVALRKPD